MCKRTDCFNKSAFSDNGLNRLMITLAFMITGMMAVGQIVENDSVRVDSATVRPVYDTPYWIPLSVRLNPAFNHNTTEYFASNSLTAPVFTPSVITPGQIAAWTHGGLTGFTSSQSMPGMMAIESGRLSVHQNIGDFTFSLYGEADKYGFYHGLQTSLGVGASMSYDINDRFGITMFGSYYTPVRAMHPAMAGYVNIPTFGGFVDYRISNRWGVQVGAKSYRSMMTQRWETQPIVMPYFRLSKNKSIGVDLGGILYQVMRTTGGKRHIGNPTLPPPVPRP